MNYRCLYRVEPESQDGVATLWSFERTHNNVSNQQERLSASTPTE